MTDVEGIIILFWLAIMFMASTKPDTPKKSLVVKFICGVIGIIGFGYHIIDTRIDYLNFVNITDIPQDFSDEFGEVYKKDILWASIKLTACLAFSIFIAWKLRKHKKSEPAD